MLFAIDIGNSHTVCGVFNEDKLIAHWRLSTNSHRTTDELRAIIAQLFTTEVSQDLRAVKHAIIASVVPAMTHVFEETIRVLFGVNSKIVGPGLRTGMPIRYEDPREVGADRIVNAVGAYEKWQCGLIVVDLGTATTFDVVSEDGAYLGGIICPGIQISSEALFSRAAKLPKVAFSKPTQVIGRNTISSIQSGLVHGYTSMVEGLIGRIKDEMNAPCKVVATGGLAAQLAENTEVVDHIDPMLTLNGLYTIHKRNMVQGRGVQ